MENQISSPTSNRTKRRTTMFSPSLAFTAGHAVAHAVRRLLDEGLFHQADVLEEVLDLAFGDLLDHLRRACP